MYTFFKVISILSVLIQFTVLCFIAGVLDSERQPPAARETPAVRCPHGSLDTGTACQIQREDIPFKFTA